MSASSGPSAGFGADPSSRPAVFALLVVLVALMVGLLLTGGRDAEADATVSCPVHATNTVVTAPPTGTTQCSRPRPAWLG
jgi:hypothetical protein